MSINYSLQDDDLDLLLQLILMKEYLLNIETTMRNEQKKKQKKQTKVHRTTLKLH